MYDNNYENLIEILENYIDKNDNVKILSLLVDLHMSDIANIISLLNQEDKEKTFLAIFKDINPEFMLKLDIEIRNQLLSIIDVKDIKYIIDKINFEYAFILIKNLDNKIRSEVISLLEPEEATRFEEKFLYSKNSAGRLANEHIITIPRNWNVGLTIQYIKSKSIDLDNIYYLYVIDESNKPIAQVSINRLIKLKSEDLIEDIMDTEIYTIPHHLFIDDIILRFQKFTFQSIPVTNDNGSIIGDITWKTIVNLIDEQAEKEIMKMGGIAQDDIHTGIIYTTKKRFTWLFLNLLTAILASSVIEKFNGVIEQVIILATLMPIIASMGGNSGTQTLTVIIRSIATREVSITNLFRIINKESVVGLINGILFALITSFMIMYYYDNYDMKVIYIFTLSIISTILSANISGVIIPFFLNKMSIDPAISSAVILTTVTDIMAYLTFLGLATLIF